MKSNQQPAVNWKKECETAIILNELIHPPSLEELDEDDVGLDLEEYHLQLYLKKIRNMISDYIEANPVPYDYTLQWSLTPVYYLDNDFE